MAIRRCGARRDELPASHVYVVALEHNMVHRAGTDGPVPMDLRVTEIFRREVDGWYMCVRHADRVATPSGSPMST